MTQATILALDTSTEACSAALLHQQRISWRYDVAPQAHTRLILPMCEQLLESADVTLSQLDAIAFGRGPGSFTGVRIGIGIAQGLAHGAGVPLIPVSNLLALAEGTRRRHQAECVFTAIDARMGEVYFAAWRWTADGWQVSVEEGVMAPEQAATVIQAQLSVAQTQTWFCSGTGFAAYPALQQVSEALSQDSEQLPRAEDLLTLARQSSERLAPELATPVYLRDKVAWKKLPGRE